MMKWNVVDIALHPLGSNYVFVTKLQPTSKAKEALYCIYKPISGERPLRDFEYGTLHIREKAAFLLSQYLGWPNIPVTVIRSGPYGEGSFQEFIQHNPSDNFFSIRDRGLEPFVDVATFDILVNNADRKGSAVLFDKERKPWAIDHGLTFNYSANVRTVMFEFSGVPYKPKLCKDIKKLLTDIQANTGIAITLSQLLGSATISLLKSRADSMLKSKTHPILNPDINLPYPFL